MKKNLAHFLECINKLQTEGFKEEFKRYHACEEHINALEYEVITRGFKIKHSQTSNTNLQLRLNAVLNQLSLKTAEKAGLLERIDEAQNGLRTKDQYLKEKEERHQNVTDQRSTESQRQIERINQLEMENSESATERMHLTERFEQQKVELQRETDRHITELKAEFERQKRQLKEKHSAAVHTLREEIQAAESASAKLEERADRLDAAADRRDITINEWGKAIAARNDKVKQTS